MSIRSQLAALALLVALPLLALAAYQIYREFEGDAAYAAEAVQRVARGAAAETRRTLDETERVLQRLARHESVRALSAAKCDPAIEDFRSAVSGFANIITIDRRANLVCSAVPPKGARTSLGELDWVQAALRSPTPYVSRPTASVVTGAPVVYVTVPLDGGLIAAALDLSSFEAVSDEHGFMDDTIISIVDRQGFMVARSVDARSWVGKNVSGQGVVDIALARGSGYVIAPGLMGVERVFGFAPVAGVPWVVYAGVRSEAVFARARADLLRAIVSAALIVAATAALVVLLARRISTQVLHQRAERERLLQRLMDSAPAIVHIKDADGRYRLVNREFEKVTGLEAGLALDRRDTELFPQELAAVITQHDQKALAGSAVLFVEETLTGPDGAARHYLAGKAGVRDSRGRPTLLCTAAVDITERKRLEQRQRQLSRRVLQASDDERQRLSRELHDRVGQPLAALRINLDVMRARLPAEAGALLDRQATLLDELIRIIRGLTTELRPPELEDIGLAAALRNFAEPAGERYGFAVDVLGSEFSPRLPRAAERALFRIAQEALANAAKHAGAETVTIELDQDEREARLSVSDDGRGFDTGSASGGFGLQTMRERVEEVGGSLEVESAADLGTRVTATLPRGPA
jgi:two-component system, NarL family, sensor histidine kinase UhpB